MMVTILILATMAVTILVFFAGYRFAMWAYTQEQLQFLANAEQDNSTLEPIFAALDREWKYTEELNKPFTNE